VKDSEITLLPLGTSIIVIQFLHGDGTPIGEPETLGRCVQL
jgi:hypothetical protein